MKLAHNIKRKLIQIAAFGFSNSQLGNLGRGKLYTGAWKQFCNPGLNCYSCPAAKFACPIGAMQAVSGSMDFNFSFYALGFLLAIGAVFGRAVCGYVCPFGLIQELIYKIPSKKLRLPRWMRYIKYAVLVVFVLILPAAITNYMGIGSPAFCKYICPSGTLLGGIPLIAAHSELKNSLGPLFALKALILAAVLAGSVVCCRFFCKTLCPLGAVYAILNKISLFRVHFNENKCVSCGKCAAACRMDIDPLREPHSGECIRCGDCAAACPTKAIKIGFKSEA